MIYKDSMVEAADRAVSTKPHQPTLETIRVVVRQRRWQTAACISEANRLASASTTLLNRMNAIKVS